MIQFALSNENSLHYLTITIKTIIMDLEQALTVGIIIGVFIGIILTLGFVMFMERKDNW